MVLPPSSVVLMPLLNMLTSAMRSAPPLHMSEHTRAAMPKPTRAPPVRWFSAAPIMPRAMTTSAAAKPMATALVGRASQPSSFSPTIRAKTSTARPSTMVAA